MRKVLICGAGGIGSRHVESMASCPSDCAVYVVDPSDRALANAVARWKGSRGSNTRNQLFPHSSLVGIPSDLDACVVATNSCDRFSVVKSISENCSVGSLILEKIVTNSASELTRLLLESSEFGRVMVNFPRRLFRLHQTIEGLISRESPLSVQVQGAEFGLLSNALHFIDMTSWWTNSQVVQVNFDIGSQGFVPSKRQGYVESDGSMRVSFLDGSSLTLECELSSEHLAVQPTIATSVRNKRGTWIFDEESGSLTDPESVELMRERPQFQSEITGPMLHELWTTGVCKLPDLSTVYDFHLKFLEAVQVRWDEFRDGQFDEVRNLIPIT